VDSRAGLDVLEIREGPVPAGDRTPMVKAVASQGEHLIEFLMKKIILPIKFLYR
jgi:hypothetical protein